MAADDGPRRLLDDELSFQFLAWTLSGWVNVRVSWITFTSPWIFHEPTSSGAAAVPVASLKSASARNVDTDFATDFFRSIRIQSWLVSTPKPAGSHRRL